MINLLVTLIVILVLLWAVRALLGAFSVAEPVSTVIWVLVVVLVVFWIVGNLLPALNFPRLVK